MAAINFHLLLSSYCQLIIALLRKKRSLLLMSKPRKRRFWVRQFLKQRKQQSQYHILVEELRLYDREYFFKFLRMSPERLERLLGLVAPFITKKKCRSRETLSPAERLVVTIRYLATGDSQQSQTFNFRLGKSTVCNIVRQTCQGIWDALNVAFVKPPTSAEEWSNIARGMFEDWEFPNCLGALDGKHIAIECPPNSGSEFYNNKKIL